MASGNKSGSQRTKPALYLRNCWYTALWSGDLAPGAHIRRVILGQPLLFVRSQSGELAAMGDVCPHRFASLSKGRFEDGIVECPYHGLRFDMSGQCVHNPHGNGKIPERARLASYPVIERHGAIWIWPGRPEAADAALIPDLSFLDAPSPYQRGDGYIRTEANYQLMSDNIMDLSHADFIHRTTLGTDGATAQARAKANMVDDVVTIEWAFDGKGQVLTRPADNPPDLHTRIEVTWHAPGVMVIRTQTHPIGDEGSKRRTAAAHIMTPETEHSTHYLFGIWNKDQVEFARNIFKTEDCAILEEIERNMDGEDLWTLDPVILSNDGGAVLARRVLARLIQREQEELAIEPVSLGTAAQIAD